MREICSERVHLKVFTIISDYLQAKQRVGRAEFVFTFAECSKAMMMGVGNSIIVTMQRSMCLYQILIQGVYTLTGHQVRHKTKTNRSVNYIYWCLIFGTGHVVSSCTMQGKVTCICSVQGPVEVGRMTQQFVAVTCKDLPGNCYYFTAAFSNAVQAAAVLLNAFWQQLKKLFCQQPIQATVSVFLLSLKQHSYHSCSYPNAARSLQLLTCKTPVPHNSWVNSICRKMHLILTAVLYIQML